MNKYFIQLFLMEKTVIMPGFGALSLLNDNFKEIDFRSDLTTDDGKLANYISETEGVDEQTAQNMIAKFIREIESNLNKGESFDIFEFGSFKKNETGDIKFESWLEGNSISTIEGTTEFESKLTKVQEESIVTINMEESKVAQPVEIKKVDEMNPELIQEPEKSMDSVALIQALLNGDFSESQPKIIAPKIAEELKKPDDKKNLDFVPKVSTNHFDENKLIVVEESEKKKKRKFPFWLFFIIISIITSSALIWYNFKTIESYLPFLSNKNKELEVNLKKDTLSILPIDSKTHKSENLTADSIGINAELKNEKEEKAIVKKKTSYPNQLVSIQIKNQQV